MSNLSITPADVSPATFIDRLTAPAAAALSAGEVLYLDSNGHVAQASAAEEGQGRIVGVALKSAGQRLTVTSMRKGVVNLGGALSGLDFGAPVYLSETPGKLVADPPGVSAVQSVTIDATGGSFTLSFRGESTDPIAHDATADAVQAALWALATIGIGDVIVTGSGGGPYTVNFGGSLGNQPVPLLVADEASLTGGDGTAVVAEETGGVYQVEVGSVEPVFGDVVPAKLLRVNL